MTLFVNANIITMQRSGETFSSMRIEGDQITALGHDFTAQLVVDLNLYFIYSNPFLILEDSKI